jgi:hypothetical protein
MIELEVANTDPARAFAVGPPRLVAGSALGGPPFDFDLEDEGLKQLDREAAWKGATPDRRVGPGATRVTRAKFLLKKNPDAPQGPYRITVVVPVEGQAPLELAIADPRPGGPRWGTPMQSPGAYVRGGWADMGGRNDAFQVIEPIGISGRRAFGRLVIGFDERFTFLYKTADALSVADRATGLSFLANVAWEPWRFPVAPYLEGGVFVGFGPDPFEMGRARWSAAPRVAGGLLLMQGSRLGSGSPLPFEAPTSPQRVFGMRIGYAHWFNTGASGGTGGIEFAIEVGFGRH